MPRHDPEISGLMQSYAFGDYIDANCTSDQSNPPSDLNFFVDERKVCILLIWKSFPANEERIRLTMMIYLLQMNDLCYLYHIILYYQRKVCGKYK